MSFQESEPLADRNGAGEPEESEPQVDLERPLDPPEDTELVDPDRPLDPPADPTSNQRSIRNLQTRADAGPRADACGVGNCSVPTSGPDVFTHKAAHVVSCGLLGCTHETCPGARGPYASSVVPRRRPIRNVVARAIAPPRTTRTVGRSGGLPPR
jgi:hypothetical protein